MGYKKYFYLEFKLRYLKNLKLFSIRVKEKRRWGFALFKNILSNARWFYGKTKQNKTKRKIGEGNLYSTENRLETKCGVLQIITIVCITHVQKDLQIRTLIKQLLIK